MAGKVVRSGKLRVGYFAQHQTEELDVAATPVVQLSRHRPRDTEQQLRTHLGAFGFSQARAETQIGNLSGGEKARLLFALISCERPNILLLDEPTNHLDIVSREALVQALNEFQGAVVIVSHDPHVIELVADRFWLFGGGRVAAFDGDMADYRALLLGKSESPTANAGSGKERGGVSRKDARRGAAERRAELAPLRKRLTEAEAAVDRLEKEKAKAEAALADPNLYGGDPHRLVDLQKQLAHIAARLADAESGWIEAQEEWDRAQAE
jgi:ATP-binding cassette subfamily F protein 3